MKQTSPLVVGGIGGSGTRVIATIISRMGYFIGNDLNSALDNLTFTLIFKRPQWLIKNFKKERPISTGLSIIEKSMVKDSNFTLRERIFLNKAVREMSKYGHNNQGEGKGQWAFERKKFIKARIISDLKKYKGWGWKEPNSHLILPLLFEYFPHSKYIHTIRHGLDMAFSSNQQQLFNWASLYGVNFSGEKDGIPAASLKYWIKANQRVFDLKDTYGDEKILILNFDELCKTPSRGIQVIANFLNIDLTGSFINELIELPLTPSSTKRYLKFTRDVFNQSDIEKVEKFGFECY